MKKLLLTAIGIGLFAVSCGTKESSMSTNKSDSANTRATSPIATDTMTKKTTNPDTVKVKKDSMATPPAK
jgi:hypothetical protein